MVNPVSEPSCREGLSTRDLSLLQTLIETRTGIKTPPQKKSLLEGRLYKRLKALNFSSYNQYCDFLFSPEGSARELNHFINIITTNKTDFFREREHFTCLAEQILGKILAPGASVQRVHTLTVWSAGCATGEEAYTLAMVIEEYRRQQALAFDYRILASDLSTSVLEHAVKGIYPEEAIIPIPMELRKKYLLRSKDERKRLVRFVPELRAHIRFFNLNFMEEEYPIQPVDIIFCRNVIIFFNSEVQRKFINRLMCYLKPDGYLFIGHSESINNFSAAITRIGHSVYRKV